jgi:hypothetical protein
MDSLLRIVIWVQVLGGMIFFPVLFGAPLSLSVKILATIVLMFISCGVFLLMTLLASLQSIRDSLRTLHREGFTDDPDVSRPGTFAPAQGKSRMGYVLLGVFALWILAGLMFKSFFGV